MLTILGLVFVIVATILVYRSASQNGHNAVLWAIITFAVGVGFQIVIPLIIGIILGVVWVSQGKTVPEIQEMIQGPANIIGIVCLILSIVGMVLVMRKVASIAEEKPVLPPPPPSDFNING